MKNLFDVENAATCQNGYASLDSRPYPHDPSLVPYDSEDGFMPSWAPP